FTSLNSQVVRLLGRDRADFLHQVIWEVCDLGCDEHFADQCRRAAAAKELVAFEMFYEPTSLWLDVRVYPSPDGLTVYFQDITARRKKEEQFRLLETCVSHLNDIVLITEAEPIDEPGPRILFVNDAFVRLTGYTREEAIGRSPRFLQGPKTQRDALDRIHAATKACKAVREEVINYSKSGEEYWLEMDIVPVADAAGHCTHLVAIERDVTERKRAEAALRASEAMMAAAQRIAHIGSWEMELVHEKPGANSLRWSAEMFRIAGFEPGTVDVTNELFFQLAHPDDHAAIRQAMTTAIREHQPYSIVHRLVRPDGQVRVVQQEAHVFFDEADGRPLKIVGTAHDITEHKSLEQQFLRAQRMESIGTLAGGIAHDLNNVLAPIMMSIDLLKLKESDPTRMNILSTIETSVKRGADMVKQVLYFARGVAGEQVVVQVGHQLHVIEKIAQDTFPKNIRLISAIPA
ncbi:MAG: PAS domain S-box protein, partial [Prosthecobacter sp.]|nr:PAS domain S-box protein [Prosthecobacter sp.]